MSFHPLQDLQQRLQHAFSDPALLERATTHRSFSADHNERLEFLGDSVLSLAVSSLLFVRLRHLPEGELSRIRAHLVRQESLHAIAVRLKLPEVLRLGEGEARSGGKLRPSILADALEAIIGAVYLDAGYERAQALVHRLFEGVELSPSLQAAAKDAKTALQEWLQGRRMKLPAYRVAEIEGAAHNQVFHVRCEVPEKGLSAGGSGVSRRAAEQAAAAAMLVQLKANKA
ncbi:ribonuclease III [Melaminivora sp.]|uniref:ribonuclease III n=1 Tax=Melaminivora sp. TaxID=1933032 RepID=UPI0028A6FBA5|nr:ribonuclease III [Melaminivora sp.]